MYYSRLGLFFLAFSAQSAFAIDLQPARDLINQGKPQAAYALLAPQADEQAGDPDFDYLFGVSAVDSGHANDAVTALERVLAGDPSNNGARLELARAYYALGADDLAKREFNLLQTLNPPPQARNAIDQYLQALELKQQKKQPKPSAFIEVGLGYDTNITAVTNNFAAGTLQTYAIELLPTDGNATLRRDATYSVAGGWSYRKPSDDWVYDFDVNGNYKGFAQYESYNTATVSANAGAGWRNGKHFFRGGLTTLASWQKTEQKSLSNETVTNDRVLLGVSGQWRWDLDENNQTTLQLQENILRYADVEVNDINQTVLSLGWVHAFAPKVIMFSNVFAGSDSAQNDLSNGTNYSRNNYGLRLGGQWQADPRISLYMTGGVSKRMDKFAASRGNASLGKGEDTAIDLALGSSWQATPLWSLRGQASYNRNDSNLNLYDYSRKELSLILRRDFR